MECCGRPMSDFSFRRDGGDEFKVPHFYCAYCNKRHFDGKDYTGEEWFFYVNEETYSDQRLKQLAEDDEYADNILSIHRHELVNRRNPEGEMN